MKRYRIVLAIMSLYLLSGCAKKTTSGVKVSTPVVTGTNYVAIRGDTVNGTYSHSPWSEPFIVGTQFFTNKEFDLDANYSENTRTHGDEGEVVYKDSLIIPFIHFRSKCKCIITDIMGNEWTADCDEDSTGEVPPVKFTTDGVGNYFLKKGKVDWKGHKYTPSQPDVFLTFKVIFKKQITRIKKIATGRDINGKKN